MLSMLLTTYACRVVVVGAGWQAGVADLAASQPQLLSHANAMVGMCAGAAIVIGPLIASSIDPVHCYALSGVGAPHPPPPQTPTSPPLFCWYADLYY